MLYMPPQSNAPGRALGPPQEALCSRSHSPRSRPKCGVAFGARIDFGNIDLGNFVRPVELGELGFVAINR